MATREDVEYQLAGLEQELRDGLARLERADKAHDHVAWYRRTFDRAVRQLREEFARPAPDVHRVALYSMEAAFLARIWPILGAKRAQWRAPSANDAKRDVAATRRQRVLDIATSLRRPTPAAIFAKYADRFPSEPVPSEPSIRRYLKK